MLEQLGKRLRQERLRFGLDQTEFGALVAVSKNSQSAYEGGKTSPTAEYLLKLAAHGVDIGYVLTGHRGDGSTGTVETQITEMFQQLDDSAKNVVFNLLLVLTGSIADAANPLLSAATLHAPRREFKGAKEVGEG